MEYSFTEVVDLTAVDLEKQIAFENLKKGFMQSKRKFDDVMDLFIPLRLKMKEEYEIEVEIIDNKILMAPEFSSYFKRFIRNFEALFYVPKLYHNCISLEFLESDKRHYPTVG